MFLLDTAIFDSSTWCNRLARVYYPGSASPFEKFSLDRSVKTWRFFYGRKKTAHEGGLVVSRHNGISRQWIPVR